MPKRKVSEFSPGRIILVSVFAAIGIGTLLLLTPAARNTPISIIDLLFTATSVTCVTGLLTVPLTSFSNFGQVIILFLIQIGGLGLITMTIFFMSIFVHLGLTTQLLVGHMLELESWKNIKKLLFFIIKFTVLIEGSGAFILFFILRDEFTFLHSLFLSIFHAISSFCNSGFSLFPNGLIHYNANPPMLIISCILMLCGGLGFITWHELLEYSKSFLYKKRHFLSLYSKIVLSTSTMIITITSILYWLLERNNTFFGMAPHIALFNAIFNAIASQSAGFITVQTAELQIATLFVIMIVAFIGSSPGSTGSGIKTTTLTIFLATIRAAITSQEAVQIKGRRIAKDQVHKAVAIVALSLGWIIITTFCLLITEKSFEFFDILFEVVSAFATLGLSTGITPYLSSTGKLFILATMIIGRIGSLTVIIALSKKSETQEFKYPEERVML